MSSLRKSTRPSYFFASSSTVGSSARHGGHHVAPKSTTVTLSDPSTSLSNVPSLTSATFFIVLTLSFVYRPALLASGAVRSGFDPEHHAPRPRPPSVMLVTVRA